MGFYKLIIFIKEAKLISTDQSRLLDSYRVRRNQTIHDLIKELKKESFDAELKKVCVQGNKIIESKEFSKIGEMLDRMELQVKATDKTEHIDIKKPILSKKVVKKSKKKKTLK
ncbi:MAG: hypothetical protein Q8P23_03005 [bacterium]|nr:hypothetical protein [bacterium]